MYKKSTKNIFDSVWQITIVKWKTKFECWKKNELVIKTAYKLTTKLHKCIKTVTDSGTSSKI